MSFVHLRTKTHRSIKEGLLDPTELIEKAKERNQDAVALTDLNTLSGVMEFQEAAYKNGVKPIFGLDAWIDPDLTQKDAEQKTPVRLLMLAQNIRGYHRLMELLTRANLENIHNERPLIKQSWLKDNAEGLIALSGDPDFGEIPQNAMLEDKAQASAQVKKSLAVYTDIFKDKFFLEVSRNNHVKEDLWVQRMSVLSQATKIPLVATHGVMYGERDDFFAHEVHSALVTQKDVLSGDYAPAATREQFFQSTEQMQELFLDLPQAVENANLIGQMCNTKLETGKVHMPDFPVPEGTNINDFFVKTVRDGLEDRLKELFPDAQVRDQKRPEYLKRLDEEAQVILNMGFPGYFLVVSDFIRWSKSQNIQVGPGRGSGAGSLVAYSLNITELDPIEHNLLFERFLNPERVSMPDIDIDFCGDRRDETIEYVRQKYGNQSVSQIATFGTLAAKAALRGVGRALNYPFMQVDELARLIPTELDIELIDALEKEPRLKERYETNKQVRRLFDMAMKLEGKSSSTGVHAGGVVIAPGHIDDFAPMMLAQGKGVMVTQFDKDDVEKAGLIKFDLLGIRTLTLLQKVKDLVDARPEFKGKPLDLNKISLNDKDALALLNKGDTYGVFQLESDGMRKLVCKLRPDNFEDVVALLALYRPGPLQSGMVDDFVKRKHGENEITYYHPKLEEILKPTYGIIVYQEQVMQIAQAIAGYTLGGADLLRRAMGKKKPEEMAKERSKFEEGAAKNGVDPVLAKSLFDLMEKFAEYGFNRSHSAAYAMLSMQTAYLKAKYPAEYFAAYMNVEMGDTDVLAEAVSDATNRGLKFLPPDVNTGQALFTPVDDNTVRYGLASLKGASEKTVADVVSAREALGEFTDLVDYLNKVNNHLREAGRNAPLKKITEVLIHAGAFDKLNPNRAELMAALPDQITYLGKVNKRVASGTTDQGEVLLPALWKEAGITPIPAPPKPGRKGQKPLVEPEWPANIEPWSPIEQLTLEAKSIGFFLTGHPYKAYADQMGGLQAAMPFEDIPDSQLGPYDLTLLAGVISEFRDHTTRDGRKMAFVTLDNGKTKQDVTIFADAYAASGKKIKVGQFIGVEARIRSSNRNPGTMDVTAEQVFSPNELEAVLLKDIHVVATKEDLNTLIQLNDKHKGDRCGMTVYLPDGEDRYFRATLPHVKWSGTTECLSDLKNAFPNRVQGTFHPQIAFAQAPRKQNRRRP